MSAGLKRSRTTARRKGKRRKPIYRKLAPIPEDTFRMACSPKSSVCGRRGYHVMRAAGPGCGHYCIQRGCPANC